MTQLSFRASSVSIDADTTEISACQKMRTDGQTDRQTAFQLYIKDYTIVVCNYYLELLLCDCVENLEMCCAITSCFGGRSMLAILCGMQSGLS